MQYAYDEESDKKLRDVIAEAEELGIDVCEELKKATEKAKEAVNPK